MSQPCQQGKHFRCGGRHLASGTLQAGLNWEFTYIYVYMRTRVGSMVAYFTVSQKVVADYW